MKEKVKNGLLFILMAALCVVFSESILSVFFPIHQTAYIDAYQYDDVLGVRLKDGIHLYNTTDYQQEVHTNKIGTVNFQKSFSAYQHLVYAIGDSYTQGTGLPSDASYPFQLDLMLNMNDGMYQEKYGVINLGLAAFGSKQSLLSLQRFADKTGKPDVVLYLAAFNDLRDDVLFDEGYRHKQLVDGNPRFGMFLKPVQWFFNEFEIGKRLKLVIKGSIRDDMLVKRYPEFDFSKLSNDSNTNGLVEVASLLGPQLDEMADYIEELGAIFIVGWAGSPEDPEPYEWVRDWAKEKGVGFADWHSLVRSVLHVIPELPVENSHSGGHFRSWVNSMIAKAFVSEIDRIMAEKYPAKLSK